MKRQNLQWQERDSTDELPQLAQLYPLLIESVTEYANECPVPDRRSKNGERRARRRQRPDSRIRAQRPAYAEAANRAKMQFLGVMSHELRTPLNAIAGYAELMKVGVHGPVTPEQEEDLERVLRSERALLALINDAHTLARGNGSRPGHQ